MKITIEGERGEGKSTMAVLLSVFLQRMGHLVVRTEDGMSKEDQRAFNKLELEVARHGPSALGQMQRRQVELVVKNTRILL
jgi:thymidylate kinase